MFIKKPGDIPEREITDPRLYATRRTVMRAGILAASTLATGWVYRQLTHRSKRAVDQTLIGNVTPATQGMSSQGYWVDEPQTPLEDITHYNNFYEFSTDKYAVADEAAKFVARPWTIAVEGMARKPRVFDLDDLLKISPPEERVYRMRCVEAWSMVIPWVGFSLSKLLERVEPLSGAKYVGFQTLLDPSRMPNQTGTDLAWPYVEGLRMDEAMHPLTLLARGLYGREIPLQNGAPLRLVVPWKYGFKGVKSIVKIRLLPMQPQTTWSARAPGEYGFYANVNPDKPHPRWSQATERRIGEGERPTLMFNGYGEQVARLYSGMNLRTNF